MGYPVMLTTDCPSRQDEFTQDAPYYGIEVPNWYWHVSNCSICRDFRNEVRRAREDENKTWSGPSGSYKPDDYDTYGDGAEDPEDYDDFPSEQCQPTPTALDIASMEPVVRITCALNLGHGVFPLSVQPRVDELIRELLG